MKKMAVAAYLNLFSIIFTFLYFFESFLNLFCFGFAVCAPSIFHVSCAERARQALHYLAVTRRALYRTHSMMDTRYLLPAARAVTHHPAASRPLPSDSPSAVVLLVALEIDV
jgi:hypothetical protein